MYGVINTSLYDFVNFQKRRPTVSPICSKRRLILHGRNFCFICWLSAFRWGLSLKLHLFHVPIHPSSFFLYAFRFWSFWSCQLQLCYFHVGKTTWGCSYFKNCNERAWGRHCHHEWYECIRWSRCWYYRAVVMVPDSNIDTDLQL